MTSWQYDGLGRVIVTVLPDTDGAGGADPPELSTSYDAMGRVLTETDALGNETSFQWDNLGRLIERTEEDPDGAGSLGNPVTAFSYDAAGNMLSLVDPAGNVTTWVYDNLYRVTSETNELSDTRSWQYDAVGNVVESTNRLGRVREFDFDGLNRLVEERWLEGETLVNTIEFGWDVASQLGVAEDDFSGYAYTYDGLGRVTQIDNAATPDTPNVVLANGYDALSRRTSQTANIDATDDYENTYTFDALSRLTRIEQTGQSGGNSVGEKRVDLNYTATGGLTQIDRYEDLTATDLVATSTFGYDDAGRLTSLDHDQDTTSLAAYTWTYDAASRITQFTSSTDGTTDYDYDNTHQLIDADHSYQTDESFAWDENGNPTGTGYSVGDDNRLLSDGTYDYQYDDEGNRTRRTAVSSGDYEDYEWDHRNRLVAVEQRNSSDALQWRVEYTYDVFDRLITRSADTDGDSTIDEVERFVYDQFVKGGLDDVVLVFDASDNLTERLLHGPAVDQVFASEDALGDILWHLGDNQNTIRDVADYDTTLDETTVVNHRTFDSFGELLSESGSTTGLLIAFQGRYRDPLTGLQNHRGRWYDAFAMRWTSNDPSGFRGGDTNVQRMVGNSPTNLVDPSGLDDMPILGSAPLVSLDDPAVRDALASVPVAPEPTQTSILHDVLSFAGDTITPIPVLARAIDAFGQDFSFTLSAGISFDVQVVFVHLSGSVDVHLGVSSEEGIDIGVSGSAGGGMGIGLGVNVSGQVAATDAPTLDSLFGEQTVGGVNAGPIGVVKIEGSDYDGFGVSGGLGVGGGVFLDEQVSFGWHTGPVAPPDPRPRPPRPSGDGREWLNPRP